MQAISSPQNDRIKLIRALNSQAKTRRKLGQIALEGVRLIQDALDAGVQPEYMIVSEEMRGTDWPGAPLLESALKAGIPCFAVSPDLMAHAAETQTPQGVIAVCPMPDLPVPAPEALSLAIILDAVGDPGNMGTILRTAAAAGVDAVFLAPGSVDPYNPKALRSGMGAHFRVPIAALAWPDITARCERLRLYMADAAGETRYTHVDWARPAGLIIGSEAHGPGPDAQRIAHGQIAIPMANQAESLNAAMAAAVILFEIRRQRTG